MFPGTRLTGRTRLGMANSEGTRLSLEGFP
jgi:hypothetical protein